MREIWKPISGFDGYYEVSNLGRVKALERLVENNGGMQRKHEKILKEHCSRGHSTVVLCKDKKTYPRLVHRLVAQEFIPNPENKPIVDHIDTNGFNNRVDNLRWVTQQENCMNPLTREHNSKSKMGHRGYLTNHTEESKQKMREKALGRIVSDETRKKLSERKKEYYRKKREGLL